MTVKLPVRAGSFLSTVLNQYIYCDWNIYKTGQKGYNLINIKAWDKQLLKALIGGYQYEHKYTVSAMWFINLNFIDYFL